MGRMGCAAAAGTIWTVYPGRGEVKEFLAR